MFASFFDLIAIGGWVVMILVALGVFALALILMKSWQFLSDGLAVNASVSKGRLAALMTQANAVVGASQLTRDQQAEEVTRLAQQHLSQLSRYLRPIEVIATIAPLIGLLGTVLGIIEAFQAMEAAGKQVDPSILSGGIWKALLTTAVGLCVAIPAMFAYNWLESQVDRFAELAQDNLSQLLNRPQP